MDHEGWLNHCLEVVEKKEGELTTMSSSQPTSPTSSSTPSSMAGKNKHIIDLNKKINSNVKGDPFTGSSKINGAKFSDACSVGANWLCMGWPFCMAEMRREFQTGGKFFCTTLYIQIS